MNTIASFLVDHDKLTKGIWLSRVDENIHTYDIRTCVPNDGQYLEGKALHTMEHLFATYARNSQNGDKVVYVGPMGCRTGFYLVVRNMGHRDAVQLIKDSFRFMAGYEGAIPGASRKECGNYLEHDLEGAKREAAAFLPIIEHWSESDIYYRQ